MNTKLVQGSAAQVATEILAVAVVDAGEKDKPSVQILSADPAIQAAAKDLLSGGEVTGKLGETTLAAPSTGTRSQTVAAGRRR